MVNDAKQDRRRPKKSNDSEVPLSPTPDDDSGLAIPTAESGNAVPTPLKKVDAIRADEAKQSAQDLQDGAHGGSSER